MQNIINLLPDNIANQIAAGEVIQRPASVIKELVENSIDAEATFIDIEILDAGRTLIQVADNGKGMSQMDARMAFQRHATSKIKRAEDLFSLCTMGFRGEALPSIAAVADVTLMTKTRDEEVGVKVELQGGEVVECDMTTCPDGSIFQVKNIFHQLPARRKFLKTNETEFRKIQEELYRIIAVNPKVRFRFSHQNKVVFDYPARDLKTRVIDLFGKRLEKRLMRLETSTPLVTIKGFVTTPSSSKKRGAQQFFFVNGRFMKHPYFHKMVLNAYEGLIPSGEYPEYFIYLEVDPTTIDVNIHPTKTEIKFENETFIAQILNTVVKECIIKGSVASAIDFEQDNPLDLPTFKPVSDDELVEPAFTSEDSSDFIPSFDPQHYLSSDSTNGEEEISFEDFYKQFEKDAGIVGDDPKPKRIKSKLSQSNNSSPNFSHSEIPTRAGSQTITSRVSTIGKSSSNIISQSSIPLPPDFNEGIDHSESPMLIFGGKYAVKISGKTDLILLKLKEVQKVVLYHKYLRIVETHKPISQRLMFPELLSLNTQEEELLQKYLPELSDLGFELSPMGGNAYSLAAVPEGVSPTAEFLYDLIHECAHIEKSTKEVLQKSIVGKMVQTIVQHLPSQFRESEAKQLLNSFWTIANNEVSPDGNRTYCSLSPKDIEKLFKK